MRTGGIANMLRRAIAGALILLVLAVAVLWVDSYRTRPRTPTPPSDFYLMRSTDDALRDIWLPLRWQFLSGSRAAMTTGDRRWIFLFASRGTLSLATVTGLANGQQTSQREISLSEFSLSRRMLNISVPANPWRPAPLVGSYTIHEVTFPCWFVMLAMGAYPVSLFVLNPIRLRRRRRRGLCRACGYDLSHSPERCPECGVSHES